MDNDTHSLFTDPPQTPSLGILTQNQAHQPEPPKSRSVATKA